MGEKCEGYTGIIIKDTCTITIWVGNRGRRWGWLGWWGIVGGGPKVYLNKNKNV